MCGIEGRNVEFATVTVGNSPNLESGSLVQTLAPHRMTSSDRRSHATGHYSEAKFLLAGGEGGGQP